MRRSALGVLKGKVPGVEEARHQSFRMKGEITQPCRLIRER